MARRVGRRRPWLRVGSVAMAMPSQMLLKTPVASASASLEVADGIDLRRRRGRGARHHRPERRRQVDAVQPDHRRRCSPMRGSDPLRRPRHHARCRRMQRCRAGIGRSFQIPQPFEQADRLREPAGRRRASAAAGARRDVVDVCADILERDRLAATANRRAGTLTLLERKRLELARALATDPSCCCSTRSPAA